MSLKSFPKPSELAVPAGAEGWEKIYPYYLVFQDKLKEQEDAKFWFCDSQHWPTVFKPFETIGGEFAVKCLGQYNARHLMIPNANGIEFRVHLGYLYMSPIPVPEDQIAARVPLFEQRVGHYFQNWDQLLKQWHVKVKGTIDEMETISFPKLPDLVPMEDILSGKGKDGSEKLLESYDRLIQLAYQNWQYHFEFLNLGYIAYLDFFNFCKQVFPNIPDQSIATMVQGVDMELFRPDDELKQLAKLAVELGLQAHFVAQHADDVEATLAAIAAAPGGDRWIAQYEGAKDPWFNFTVGNGFYGHDKYWNEHQEIPLGYIADYIRRVDEGQEIMRPVEALIAERDRIIEEYRELLEGENQALFDAKRGLAATAYPYVENHNFYIEHWTMGVFWRKIRELSRMMQAEGFWTEPDDLLYLGRNEVRDALFDLVTGWGVGAKPIGPGLLAGRDRAPPRNRGRAQDRPACPGAEHPAGIHHRTLHPDAVGHHHRAGPAVAGRRRGSGGRRPARHGCLAGRGRGPGPRHHRRGPALRGAAGRDPGRHRHRAVLGPDLRQDQGHGHGHRRHDEPRGHRLPGVRSSGGDRNGFRLHHHQDRPAAAGGRHQGHRADPRCRPTGAPGHRTRRPRAQPQSCLS